MKHIGLIVTLMFAFSFSALAQQKCVPNPNCKPSDCKKVVKASKDQKATQAKGVLTLYNGKEATLTENKKKNCPPGCKPICCKKDGKNAKAMKASNVKTVSNSSKSTKRKKQNE